VVEHDTARRLVSNGGRPATFVYLATQPLLHEPAVYGFVDLYLGAVADLERVAARLAWLLGAPLPTTTTPTQRTHNTVREKMTDNLPAPLTPGEVARMFRVDPKTVTRWSNSGRLPAIRTMGGHRRYRLDDVLPYIGPFLPDGVQVEGGTEAARPWTTQEETYVCRDDLSLIDVARRLDRPLEAVVTKRLALRGHRLPTEAWAPTGADHGPGRRLLDAGGPRS
jgi:excisionase family DNA binding protein